MNQQPKREGFVEADGDHKVIDGKVIDAEPRRPRTVPPPEIEPSPAEVPTTGDETQWPMTIKLVNKQIRNNQGEKISEITLREPRAGDINRYGNPVRFTGEG